jgi:ribosomal protein L32E
MQFTVYFTKEAFGHWQVLVVNVLPTEQISTSTQVAALPVLVGEQRRATGYF